MKLWIVSLAFFGWFRCRISDGPHKLCKKPLSTMTSYPNPKTSCPNPNCFFVGSNIRAVSNHIMKSELCHQFCCRMTTSYTTKSGEYSLQKQVCENE